MKDLQKELINKILVAVFGEDANDKDWTNKPTIVKKIKTILQENYVSKDKVRESIGEFEPTLEDWNSYDINGKIIETVKKTVYGSKTRNKFRKKLNKMLGVE